MMNSIKNTYYKNHENAHLISKFKKPCDDIENDCYLEYSYLQLVNYGGLITPPKNFSTSARRIGKDIEKYSFNRE